MFILGVACKKDPMPTTSGEIDPSLPTTQEAATTLASALSTKNYGLSTQLSNATSVSQFGYFQRNTISRSLSVSKGGSTSSSFSLCGLKRDTLFSITGAPSTSSNYKYAVAYYVQVNCSSNQPSNMIFADSTSGSVTDTQVNYVGNSKIVLSSSMSSVSADSTITFNGTYDFKGSAQSKIINKSTFSYNMMITFSDLTIGKNSGYISKGTASIQIEGASKTTKYFRYIGSADFSSPNQIKMTLENQTYVFNINTGLLQ